MNELRLAVRRLLEARTFTAAAVVTLALGIGASTAIFTVVNSVLLRPLPYRDSERLVHLWEIRASRDYGRSEASYPDFEDWKAASRTVERFAGYAWPRVTLRGAGDPEEIQAARVTDSFFEVLGVAPALGRTFVSGEEREGAAPVAVLSDALWRTRFGADRGIVGRTVHVDGQSHQVVGVLPRDFHFAPSRGAAIWLPLRADETQRSMRGVRWVNVIARLRPGVTPAAADRELDAIAARIAARHPETNEGASVEVVPLRDQLLGPVRPVVLLLGFAASLVFLIACANVGSLMIGRVLAGERGIAVRVALGAGRAAIVRHLLAEAVILTAAGAALGISAGLWVIRGFVASLPAVLLWILPALRTLSLDLRFAALLTGVLLVCVLATGLWPALGGLRLLDAGSLLNGRGIAGGRRGRRLRSALVVFEVGLALLLLTGAGLMLRSVDALFDVDPGYEPAGVLTMRVAVPAAPGTEDAALDAVRERAVGSLRNVAGVQSVSAVSKLPSIGGGTISIGHWLGEDPVEVNIRLAGAGYFDVMRIPVVRGREFGDRDRAGSQPVALVSRLLALRHLGGEEVVGRTIRIRDRELTIAGVVGDERVGPLDEPVTPVVYLPMAQFPDASFSIVLRTASEPMRAAQAAQRAVRGADPQIAVSEVLPMTEVVGSSPMTFLRTMSASVIGAFAVVSLLLAVVGLYAVTSESVAARSREIGVRISFGARPAAIAGLMLREGLVLVILGAAGGAAAAAVLARGMRSLLYGIGPHDPLSFAAAAAVLLGTAGAAALIPGLRAARTDPVVALRQE